MQLFQGTGRLALIGTAMLALALGGCGRKPTNLDLPPQAAVQTPPAEGQPAQPGQPRRNNPLGLFDPTDDDPQPYVPGQKRRIILDNILD